MLNLKIKSRVRCSDREVGEVSHVVVNSVSKEISHLVLNAGAGGGRYLVPLEEVLSADAETVTLRRASSELSRLPAFRREDFHELKEVELAGVERRLHVHSGEPLMAIPELEKDVTRRRFFTQLTHAIGIVLALPLAYPILRYIVHPMYQPLSNVWLKLGDVSRLETDKPQTVKFNKEVREGFLVREFQKSHWVVRPSEELRAKIYGGKPLHFENGGKVYWENDPASEVVVMSGKCPHLGCAFKWKENHKKFGKVFWCPCHLSIYDASGKVLDGPAPRRLDILPTRIGPGGSVEIIDAEFKAGKAEMIRVV